MLERLSGKTMLVAGAGNIGSGLARRFAAEGANVVLGDAVLKSAEATVGEIAAEGGSAIAVRLDGADERSAAAAVSLACERFGRLDGMHVNFASFVDQGFDTGILELPLADFDETMAVNLRGYYLCTRAALPALLKQGGSIVYTSSPAACKGEPTRAAYAIAKAGVEALMRHVAARYAEKGLRSNCISPGSTIPEPLEREMDNATKEFCFGLALIKSRLGRPEDIAAMSALLMSDEGAYITGQVIGVDGGVVMRR
jgi:NAD(P)-dependent dehydrogenase (short-subunit alcohol dehydrogenase family)